MVNSVPPAKSMPSRKPLVAIERMPGMMITREIAKNMLRRPMVLSPRTGGAGRGSSTGVSVGFSGETTPSATCSAGATSDSSDSAVHSHQPRPSEGAACHDDGKQVVRDDDRRDQARNDADAERDRKSLHRRRTDEAQDHAGD